VTGSPEDRTLDPELRSWVPVPDGSDFPIQNLPYGVFHRPGLSPRAGVAIGDWVLDLQILMEAGFFARLAVALPEGVFVGSLNRFASLGPAAWRAVRERLSEGLRDDDGAASLDLRVLQDRALAPLGDVELLLPVQVGDYVDFYSSIEHASNLGRMFRPDTEPLLPNWRHMPVGYHGRSGTVVVSGTPIHRPSGQTMPEGTDAPVWGPTRMLDVELEVGFVTGAGNRLGTRVPVEDARDHIFGVVLVNDWSARDIQRWEYQPLGPFLGKSFATSISPWVVTLDALEGHRVPGPTQDPPPLGYLSTPEDWAFDIELSIEIQSAPMETAGIAPAVISRTNYRHVYWSMAQQLAHVTSNGASVREGDLYASGTISGSAPDSYGSLIELTWNGKRPIALPDGAERTFLVDGDTVIMRGWCGNGVTGPRIGFGECRGTIMSPGGP
jgi:fumarylacetoacetase